MNIYFKIASEIILGFILADIVTGTFHWFEDTYLSYCINLPILSSIAKDNELHHYFPRGMLAYSYMEHLTYTLPGGIFIVIMIYLLNPKLLFKYKFFFITFFIFFSLANLFHRLAHMRECEKNIIINKIQDTGLLCSHEHHKIHHINNQEKYCVICEYTNYMLDNVNYWRNLENLIFIMSGVKPNRVKNLNGYKSIFNHMHFNSENECPDKPTRHDVENLKKKLHKFKMKEC